MIAQNLQTSNILNDSSFLSSAGANGNKSVELCKTCQFGIGGVGEAAEKIKVLALGIYKEMALS